jgi:hypothetical protein
MPSTSEVERPAVPDQMQVEDITPLVRDHVLQAVAQRFALVVETAADHPCGC